MLYYALEHTMRAIIKKEYTSLLKIVREVAQKDLHLVENMLFYTMGNNDESSEMVKEKFLNELKSEQYGQS